MGKDLSSISYKVIRRRRKTVGIKVTEKGEVIITSPFGISEETISDIVKKKQKWIIDKVNLVKLSSSISDKDYRDGEKFLFLGRELELERTAINIPVYYVEICEEKLKIYGDSYSLNSEKISEAIIGLYKKEATKILRERTKIFSKIIGVNPKRMVIKDQKTVWGSCSSKGNINYNYRIIMAPISIIDYIVVHELCHLIHMNHSKDYWSKVKEILPDYEERRQWLKKYGHLLKV